MEVLMTIPGIDDEITAGAIIEEREGLGGGASSAGGRTGAKTSALGSRAVASAGQSSARSAGGAARTGVGAASGAGSLMGSEEEDYSFKSVGDFMSRIPGLDSGVSRFVTHQSGTFRLVIEGQAAGIKHAIQAIAEYDGKKVRYLRWREDP